MLKVHGIVSLKHQKFKRKADNGRIRMWSCRGQHNLRARFLPRSDFLRVTDAALIRVIGAVGDYCRVSVHMWLHLAA